MYKKGFNVVLSHTQLMYKFIRCVRHNLYFVRSRSQETFIVIQNHSFDLTKSAKPFIYILYKRKMFNKKY
ncbi:hypothetical protein TSAR_014128 [Trichomalopsis sarcophagae]|uniref:Uncharacterized protein n=1 Tax=Trichomalopsis sarcophagae TaxID=543379 RepID=A0A232F5E2_9HYME|nr:hypothetical protein TSAR_014128 [Trichomalopsis sarcophagae]